MRSSRIAVLAVLVFGGPAVAQTVDATSMTRLSGRQDPRDGVVHTVVPAYEDVWLSARDLEVPGVEAARVVVSAWAMVAGGDTLDGDNVTGDVDVAYVEGKLLARRLSLRLGRQLVASGVARNLQLDGLDVIVRGPEAIALEVYGGVPVAPRFGYARGQAVVGGRLSWRPAQIFEGGVSFVDLFDDGLVDRQELGVDARLFLTRKLTLTGLAAWSVIERRLSEGTVRALYQPLRELELTLEGARTAPDLFVSRASIFSVFAETTRDELGTTLYVRPWPRLRLWADGFLVNDDAGTGGRASLRASIALDRAGAGTTQVGAEGRVLALPDSRYVQGRIFARHRFPQQITASIEGDLVALHPAINQQDLSATISASVGWAFLPAWNAVVTGVAGQTPLLSSRYEAMAKLVYVFASSARTVAP